MKKNQPDYLAVLQQNHPPSIASNQSLNERIMKKIFTKPPYNTEFFNSKKFTWLASFMILLLSAGRAGAQCTSSGLGLQDPIQSSFHSTVTKATSGTFYLWGESCAGGGPGVAFLTPTAIAAGTAANQVGTYTGTPRLVTLGSSGSTGATFFMVTSDALYAWGTGGLVVNTSIKASGKITTAMALPSGIAVTDIKNIDASGGGLVLLTNAGTVYQIGITASYGDGTTVADAVWHLVKTDPSTTLTGITDVRTCAGACIATNGTQLYTWGTVSYLGDNSATATYTYATPMANPLPGGVTVKQLDIANGTGKSYYVLGSNNTLYTLGGNNYGQLGDGTTNISLTWVTAGNGVFSNNVSYVSANNHNGSGSSFAAAAIITTSKKLIVFGCGGAGMLGTSGSPLNTNPSTPSGFNAAIDQASTVEIGGHTGVFQKPGSSKFCYMGHSINGSMGDGLSAGFNRTTADCDATPQLPGFGCSIGIDHGDAPSSYGDAAATFSDDYDLVTTGFQELRLGALNPDSEDGPNSVTLGSTNNSGAGDGGINVNDEDGIAAFSAISAGQTSYSVSVTATNTSGSAAVLGGWIDWNNDGVFSAGEGVTIAVPNGSSNAVFTLTWTGINSGGGALCGTQIYGRFRIAPSLTTSNFTGSITNGEVEDYQLPAVPGIFDFGDLSTSGSPVWPIASSRVATCTITAGIPAPYNGSTVPTTSVWAGLAVNTEASTVGGGNASASTDNYDDGLGIPAIALNGGYTYPFSVTLNANRSGVTVYYRLWFDWNNDGNFTNDNDGNGNPATYTGSGVTASPVTMVVLVKPPFGAAINYKVRLVVSDAAIADVYRANTSAYVLSISNGEIEDYNAPILLLPITLVDFSAIKQIDQALLKWSTSSEQDSKTFIVERSNSAQIEWHTVGTVAAAGNSNTARNYALDDVKPMNGANYYRLRTVNVDGTYSVSGTRLLNFSIKKPISVYPNPMTDMVMVTGAAAGSNMQLLDASGKMITQQIANGVTDKMTTTMLIPGMYLLKVTGTDGVINTIKVRKQ